MNRKFLYAAAALLVVAGIFGLRLTQTSGVEVVQCTNQSTTCDTAAITEYRTGCDPYAPWDSLGSLNCSTADRNIGEISMVTDAANYVRAPMGERQYSVEVINDTGRYPWDLEFLPSDEAVWTNKGGAVRIRDDGETRKIDELKVLDAYETGLLGLAVDPDFRQNRNIYLYYTGDRTNRSAVKPGEKVYRNYISRFKLTEDGLEEKEVLVTVPGSKYHSGGRLEFGPDNKLYITTGEAGMLYRASNRSNLAGKILRINRDGSIPEDNPFNSSPVFSMGHRNPQGLAWSPDGQLYNTEHGQWRHDEINRVVAGEKYGWSGYRCGERKRLYGEFSGAVENLESYYDNTPPVHCFDEWTIAPSGATFVNDTESPWHGDLFVAGLRGKQIMRFEFEDGEMERNEVFYTSKDEPGVDLRMRDVEYHNGSLYAVSDVRGLVRLTLE